MGGMGDPARGPQDAGRPRAAPIRVDGVRRGRARAARIPEFRGRDRDASILRPRIAQSCRFRRYLHPVASIPTVPAVVTALNLNGLGVARALGRRGVPVYAVHTGGEDGPELRTRHVREVWRPSPGQSLVELLLERGRAFGELRPVLLPITDESVEAVAHARDRLASRYRIPMGDPRVVLRQLSKEGVAEAAAKHGMPVPATRACATREELEVALRALRAPYILKPQDKSEAYARSGAKKAYRLETADEVHATYASFSALEPRVVLQEFIPGTDADVWFCLLAMGRSGKPLASFVGHKIRQWPPHCGGTSSCEPAKADELVGLPVGYFGKVGLRGPGSIEFKRDPRDGRFYMIEPTVCRTDWQSAVADDNGVPIPYFVWCDETDTPLPALRPSRLRWRWVHLNSDRRSADYYRGRGELGFWSWLWSIRPPVRPAYFAIDDPGPALSIAVDGIRRVCRKLGRLVGLSSRASVP